MGILDFLFGLLRGRSSGSRNMLADIVMKMVADPNKGGLNGLLKSCQDKGMGDECSSWVGTGKNLPLSVDQITKIFSGGQLADIARQAGISEKQAAGELKDILPEIVDRVTPEGKVPEGDMLSKGLDILRSSLFR